MEDSITFKGLRHYPVGNARIQPYIDRLVVSNLCTSLDGITIETRKSSFIDLQLNPVFIDDDADIGVTFNQIDNSNQFGRVAQWAITHHRETAHAYLMLNSRLEGEQITVKGYQRGAKQFHRVLERPGISGYKWQIIAAFNQTSTKIALTGIDCRLVMVRDRRERVIKVNMLKSFRCSGTVIPMFGKSRMSSTEEKERARSFSIDRLQIDSTMHYPEGLPEEKESYITQAVITGQGMSSIVVTGESYSRV